MAEPVFGESENRLRELEVENQRLRDALQQAHRRIDELAGDLDVEAVLRRGMPREVRDLLRTKTFRWTRWPRRVYAKIRFGNAGRVPRVPD